MNVDRWLIHSVSVAVLTGKSNKGDPTFGSPTAVACRIEGSTVTLRSGTGIETATQTRILTSTAIAKSSRVWLPGTSTSDATAAKVPQKVRPVPSIDGSYTLYEIFLG